MDASFQAYLTTHVPGVASKSAQAVLELAAEGATVPFIARYRKERTGNLDEVEIRKVIEANETFQEIVKRKAFLLKEIEGQGNLTDELKARIDGSWDLGDLEEIYRPYKKKKKTKATIAREAGLEPLANWIWQLGHGELTDATTLEVKAKDFLNAAAGFVTYELALKGAQDIIVEKLANNPELREFVRVELTETGKVVSKASKEFKAHSKYEMYKEFSEPVKSLMETKASHRYLAMRRGWSEGELAVVIQGDEEALVARFESVACTQRDSHSSEFLKNCAKVALTVHVHPSITNEIHRILKEQADKDAITVFAENVRRVLLGSPFGSRCVLGVDPGLRTGCKIALIDKQGNFISHTVMQILGDNAEEKAKALFGEVLKQIKIDAIAVGNGTAGRETETFLRKVLKSLEQTIPVVLVSESGASVYSASDLAREEFPDLDLTVRGAISIARRLQDPLAELVKVDPKSIGVGQYQHDVSQTHLKKSLEEVVESCVNGVGVDLNTASAPLLAHVSGIGPQLAKNIVEHRQSVGLFEDRSDLMKVPRFSSKVYEQCAGFLRIMNGKVVLDQTGIHPERYAAVRDMAQEIGTNVSSLIGDGAKKLLELRTKWAALVGEYTFDDIIRELEKPGRDPRDPFKVFSFREDLFEVKDLKDGMICPGIVTNVTNFGAFVDVGVHQDGLVHISELSHKFVDDPRKVVAPGDQVSVRVLAVDRDKNQISLSMLMDSKPRANAGVATDDMHAGGERGAGRAKQPRAPRADRPSQPRDGEVVVKRAKKEGGIPPEDKSFAGAGGARGDQSRGNDATSARREFKPGAKLDSKNFGRSGGGGKPSGPRPERSERREGGAGRSFQSGDSGMSGGNKQQRPGQPFNNPFAALAGLKSDRKE